MDGPCAGRVFGAYVHGLFLCDDLRRETLGRFGIPVATGRSYQASVDGALDELAAELAHGLDIEAMLG